MTTLRPKPILVAAALAAFLGRGGVAMADPVLDAWSGTWARYEALEEPPGHPRATEARLSVVPEPDVVGAEWIRWEARSAEGPLFAFEVLVDSAQLLSPLETGGDVLRYVLRPGGGPAIEYVDRETGGALLPRFGFATRLVPKVHGALPEANTLPIEIDWLGRTFRRVEIGRGADPVSHDGLRTLVLDPDVLVGTGRTFRDDGTGREASLIPGRPGEYRYVEFEAVDYEVMIDAGMNLFRVPAAHLPWVIDEPVFFITYEALGQHPELLFRSNYLGASMYMDEPAHRLLSRHALGDVRSPEEGAELLVEVTRGRYEGDTGYGRRFLQRVLRRAGFRWGGDELLQPDLPVWEAVAGAAWYVLEAGPAGLNYQGRFQPREFSELVEASVDVDFPDDARSCILAHVALLRGAARHFDSRWGVTVYGQMDPEAAEIVFPIAYRRGATYFWLWTSDGDHHVPRTRQLELVRAFRDFVHRERMEPGGAPRVPRNAETAVVLPWGYPLDEYALQPFARGEEAGLWRSRHLTLDDRNDRDVTHRRILALAFRESARLLRAGEEYDVLFLRPGETAEGYDSVVRIRPTGEVDVR